MAALVVAACGTGEEPAPVITAATGAAATTAASTGEDANALEGFGRTEIVLGEAVWAVAVADTPTLRSRGLMHVTELVGVDGMLFVWDRETSAAFWMKDTLIPLDIAFFDAAGELVEACEPAPWRQYCSDHITMTPCDEDPCPTYPSLDPVRYALETEVGGFDGIELSLDAASLAGR